MLAGTNNETTKRRGIRLAQRLLGGVALAVVASACAGEADDVEASEEELRLEQDAVPTGLSAFRAGMPYLPGVDESPTEVGAPCLRDATVSVVGGAVEASATLVTSRTELAREVGFSVNGTVPGSDTVSAAASITSKTAFDAGSAVLVFQASGTYDSVLSEVGSVPAFSPRDVSRCGYGYAQRASHRVSSVLVVTVRSSAKGSNLSAGVRAGKTGVAEGSASVSSLLNRGDVELSIRYAADAIPGMPTPPFADAPLVVDNTAEAKEAARHRLERSLAWLSSAEQATRQYVEGVQRNASTAVLAPARSLLFRFYPGMPANLRRSAERAATRALEIKGARESDLDLLSRWETFSADERDGMGMRWNIPGSPARVVDELVAKKREMLETRGGTLRMRVRAFDERIQSCTEAFRNRLGADTTLAAALEHGCRSANEPALDVRSYDVRPIRVDVAVEGYRSLHRCRAGFRLPLEEEAPIFGPWSRAARASKLGLWMYRSGCDFSEGWIYDGEPTCTPLLSTKLGVHVCVPESGAIERRDR